MQEKRVTLPTKNTIKICKNKELLGFLYSVHYYAYRWHIWHISVSLGHLSTATANKSKDVPLWEPFHSSVDYVFKGWGLCGGCPFVNFRSFPSKCLHTMVVCRHLVIIFMTIVKAMLTMMMKLWETSVKDCCRRPATGLCFRLTGELADESQKKQPTCWSMHACAHTCAQARTHTHMRAHASLHTAHHFVINLNVASQHWTGDETTPLGIAKVVQCFQLFQHFCYWHRSCAPLAIKLQ